MLRLKQQVLLDLYDQLLELGAIDSRHGPEDYLRWWGRAVHNWTFVEFPWLATEDDSMSHDLTMSPGGYAVKRRLRFVDGEIYLRGQNTLSCSASRQDSSCSTQCLLIPGGCRPGLQSPMAGMTRRAATLPLPTCDQYQLGFLGLGGHTGTSGTKLFRFGIWTFGRLWASMTSDSWTMPFL